MNSVAPLRIGVNGVSIGNYLSAYLADVTFVEGLALTPASFGVLSGANWIPKDYTGVFGTNGFKLGFATNTSAFISPTSLGADTSGNSNSFNPVKLYTGNATFDSSIGWFFPNPPASYNWLALAPGGCSTSQGGGGAGGVVGGSQSPVACALTQIPQMTFGSSVTFGGLTAVQGNNACSGNGATSGAPQSFPGGPASLGGGGGGGAAGAGGGGGSEADFAAGGGGGAGISCSITGTSVNYGVGGGGGGGPQAPPGTVPAGQGGLGAAACFVIGHSSSSSPASLGAALPVTVRSIAGVTSYSITSYNTNNLPLLIDWLFDTPTPSGTDTGAGGQVTGNYAILNPARSGVALTNGNLDYVSGATAGVLASQEIYNGMYYWEVQPTAGIALTGTVGLARSSVAGSGGNPGSISGSYAYNLTNGQTVTNAIGSAYGTAFGINDVMGIAFDANNGKLYFAKNNVWQNGSNPVTATNPAFSALTSPPYLPAFGGAGSVLSVNFGQRPFVYNAPTGYKVLVENPTTLTLDLTDAQSLADFQLGDLVAEVPGDGFGVVKAIDLITFKLSLSNPAGTWTVGSTVIDNSRTIPVPAPTTNPPDPLNYFLIDSSTNSTVNLTSWTVAKPPLDALRTYDIFVSYKSNATVVTSSPSPWSRFITGTL